MDRIKLPTAVYIATGNELISGEIAEGNARQLALLLKKDDIQLCEIRILPDDVEAISSAVNRTRVKYDYVFVSGGIGIAENDVTAISVAKAFGCEMVCNKKLLSQLKKKYPMAFKITSEPDEIRMAYIPSNATVIESEISDVPAFFIDNVFVLPGNPKVFNGIAKQINQNIKARQATFSHSAVFTISEAMIADIIRYVANKYDTVEVQCHAFIGKNSLGSEVLLKSQYRTQLELAIETLHSMIKNRMSSSSTKKKI